MQKALDAGRNDEAMDAAARRAPVVARYDSAAARTWLSLHPKLGAIPVDLRLVSGWHRARSHKPRDAIRVAFISDTHSQQVGVHGRRAADGVLHIPPDTDVLIHCGDFSRVSGREELDAFAEWFSKMGPPTCKQRLVVHGNHDSRLFLPPGHRKSMYRERWAADSERIKSRAMGARSIHGMGRDTRERADPIDEEFANRHKGPGGERLEADAVLLRHSVIPLHDECVTLMGGIVVCGLPWNSGPREFERSLAAVPADGAVDILVTHGPPAGHGDAVVGMDGRHKGSHLGSPRALVESARRIRPRVHAFGHIHEGYGVTIERAQGPLSSSRGVGGGSAAAVGGAGGGSPASVAGGNGDGGGLGLDRTLFVNASSCDRWQQLHNPPIVVDLVAKKKKGCDEEGEQEGEEEDRGASAGAE